MDDAQRDGETVLVLGASSFSGQDLVDLLLEAPDLHVIGVGRSAERSLFLRHHVRWDLSRYRYHQIDMNRQKLAIPRACTCRRTLSLWLS